MSSIAIEDPKPGLSEGLPAAANGHGGKTQGGGFEAWLNRHVNAVAGLIVLAGFAVRFYASTRAFFNPDEVLHYIIINQPSAWLAYKASLGNAHPPLIFLVLYAWHFLGHSEVFLRFPSVVLGTAACGVAFLWLRDLMGKAAGLIGLTLFAFSPSMVALSAQTRGYALLLLCMSGALYFLARAFRENSAGKMWCFTICLYLAVLSHYSAVFFTVAAGLYVIARFSDSKNSRRLLVPWALGQVGAAAIYAILYVTHISKIRGSIAVWSTGFSGGYFQLSGKDIFTFTGLGALKIFAYLFGELYVACAMLLVFAVAAGILFAGDLRHRTDSPQLSHLSILVLFPFFAIWGASLAGIYPFEGSRHTVFLAPLAFAGVSYLLPALLGRRLWICLLAGFSLVACSNAFAEKPAEPGVSSGIDGSPAAMAAAVNYMNRSIPRGDRILVDYQSFPAVIFYYCGPQASPPMDTSSAGYFLASCNGHSIVSVHYWQFIAPAFSGLFTQMARDNGLRPGDPVWVYQTGWDAAIDKTLPDEDPRFRCLRPKRFGGAAVVIPFVVGSGLTPEVPAGSCSGSPN